MNADTGEIREMMGGWIPSGDWKELKQGQKVSFNGLFFQIAFIDVKSQRVGLSPLSRKEYLMDLTTSLEEKLREPRP